MELKDTFIDHTSIMHIRDPWLIWEPPWLFLIQGKLQLKIELFVISIYINGTTSILHSFIKKLQQRQLYQNDQKSKLYLVPTPS